MTAAGLATVEPPTPQRPGVVVSNVLLSGSLEILLGLRGDCLKWELPGGKVEAESVIDAARREQREETGMALTGRPVHLGFTDGWAWSGREGRKWFIGIHLLWKTWEGFPQVREEHHLQWRWFPLHRLPPLENCTPATRELLTTLLPAHIEREMSRTPIDEQEVVIEPFPLDAVFLPEGAG